MNFDKNKKSRGWTFILYPESAPEFWVEMLRETHIPILISPLHDSDVWTAYDESLNPEHKAGELKKPHHHVMMIFNGGARYTQPLGLLAPLGIDYVEPVASITNLTRYFAHMDDEDKAQYDFHDIVSLNGAVIDLSRELTPEEQREIRTNMVAWIRDNCITEYAELICYCMDCEPDWMDYASTHTMFLNNFIKSIRHSYAGQIKAKQAEETSE